jgi:broad specificity phosphatase PhoE
MRAVLIAVTPPGPRQPDVRATRPMLPAGARAWTSPAPCARQAAAELGLSALVSPALDDLDLGAWAGRPLPEALAADPDAARRWHEDPDAAPHGGESITALHRRVGDWLDGLDQGASHVAVTHPAVVRAAVLHALGAPALAAWHLDVAGYTHTHLSRRAGHWRVQRVAEPLPTAAVGEVGA